MQRKAEPQECVHVPAELAVSGTCDVCHTSGANLILCACGHSACDDTYGCHVALVDTVNDQGSEDNDFVNAVFICTLCFQPGLNKIQ